MCVVLVARWENCRMGNDDDNERSIFRVKLLHLQSTRQRYGVDMASARTMGICLEMEKQGK